MQIIYNGKSIKLPKKEGEIVNYFLSNKNRIISVPELTLHVWEYDNEPSIATVRTYIKNIRKHFNNHFMETIKGLGYMFKVE
jgi:DNA-binding response OmpR family regulator